MDDLSRLSRLAELAPLTRSFAMHLAQYILRSLPRDVGRPRRGEQEQRLLEAMDTLTPLVQEKRELVFEEMASAVQSGQLTTKWFVQILNEKTPGETMVYPQRVTEWKNAHLLFLRDDGQLDPQSVCCILITRMLNPGRTAWLPPRPVTVESYYVWRQNTPHSAPFPFELPSISDPQAPTVMKRSPFIEENPYLLYSHWKGVSWDSGNWLVVDDGAICWVGDVSNEQAVAWLKPNEHRALAEMPNESIPRRVLRVLARSRLARDHQSTSNNWA